MSTHYSAARAAEHLGVSQATLYSYVSRGLLRSRAVRGKRSREYSREDVERLAAQTRGRRDPLGVARQALDVEGLPVLSSALCLIDGGRVFYRGRDAVALSREARFEEVAALLWDGPCVLPAALPRPSVGVRRQLARLEFASAAIAHLASLDARRARGQGASVAAPVPPCAAGSRALTELAALAAGFAPTTGRLAARLGRAFGASGARVERAIDAALILCADHELNASAFAARVVASTGASLYMALAAALGALSGDRHGGATAAVERLFPPAAGGAAPPLGLASVVAGTAAPGFGHPLYPDGDPRARRLLELCPRGAERTRARALASAMLDGAGVHPNLDFGLVSLCRSLQLPREAPFVLFALGRTAGWVGHIQEQYASAALIRPRARYVGEAPGATA